MARLGGTSEELVNSGVSGQRAGELWGVPARWVAHRAPIDGEVVNVVVFDHPLNFGFPSRWQVRPYGLVAVNPFGRSPSKVCSIERPNRMQKKEWARATRSLKAGSRSGRTRR